MSEHDGGPAFPHDTVGMGVYRNGGEVQCLLRHPGMSSRALFAVMIFAGYRAGAFASSGSSQEVAHWAVQDADALIAELEKASE